jgi:hypothetical protein
MGREFVIDLLGVRQPDPAANPLEAMRLVRFHGLEGLCVARSRESGRALLPDDMMAVLEPTYRMQALTTTLTLESAHRARALLAAERIDSLLFKGAALVADGTYSDPGARRMDDADLLVGRAHASRAVETLLDGGFLPATGWDSSALGWADAVALHDGDAPAGTSSALDLHWRTDYDRLRFGGNRESPLWEGADLEAGLPSAEAHLVLTAEHLLKHLRFKIHVAAFGDLARLAGRVQRWDRVEALTARSRLTGGITALLYVIAQDLGAAVPATRRRTSAAGLRQLLSPRSLIGRVRPVQGRARGILSRWRLLGSPARIWEDMIDAALPPREWLSARYGHTGFLAWGRYASDVARWAAYRGRSPASPNQSLFDPEARD